MLYVLIILGFVFIGASIYFSVQSYDTASRIAMVLAVVLIVGAGIAFMAGQSGSSKPSVNSGYSSKTDDYGHDEFDAVVAAENVVKNKLKSPASAKFCKHKEYTITRSGNTWTIKGYVDAQNSFGATLRNTFTVRITFTSSNKYTIDSCVIN